MASISETPIISGYSTATDVRPYMKPRRLSVRVTGVRPNTTMYAFYNGINVSSYCRPAEIPTGGSASDESTWNTTGDIGASLSSDASGTLTFFFYVPAATFLVGTGTLIVKDATNDSYTTKAEVTYNSLNFPQSVDDVYDTSLVQVEATVSNRQITDRSYASGGFNNPLSQVFFVSSQMARNKEGILLSKLDLYFTKKDSTFGCVVEIRSVENGTPTNNTLAMSRVRLNSSDINTSGATTVSFPGLVFIAAGKHYALTIVPDGGASNYEVATAKVNERDTATNNTIAKTWEEGKLFLPTNGSDWPSITDECLKFKLYYAAFSANNGYATLTNKNYEFLSVNAKSGDFTYGEYVALYTLPKTGSVLANSASYELIGSGTTFTTDFLANGFITIANGSNTDIDIIRIRSISNNTYMVLQKKPSFNNAFAEIRNSPIGMVDVWNSLDNQLTLVDSTSSNASFIFTANTQIVGADSGAYANVVSVDNLQVNKFQPLLSYTSVVDTELRLSGNIRNASYTDPGQSTFAVSGTNVIGDRSAILASRTNEILYAAGNKSISMNVALTSAANTLSPVLDLSVPSLVVHSNKINSNTTNEHLKTGSALSKVITKTATLADGLDSEDIVVYLDAWKPPGTELAVYVKLLNASDPASLDGTDWTRLTQAGNTVYSDAVNSSNYVELKYVLPSSPSIAALQTGAVSIANNSTTVTGVGTAFNSAVSAGSIIRFDSGASQFITRVASVTNATSMVIASNAAFTSTTATYSTLTTEHTAFKNPQTDIVRYFGYDGVIYDTFKTFAVKVVFLSDYSYLAPEVDNIRVICSS